MWSTWCSVLMTYLMGPRSSASWRILTALLGSCGVSTTTTPAVVTTKLGLQPRSLVEVNTFSVTCCTACLLARDEYGRHLPLAWSNTTLCAAYSLSGSGRRTSRTRHQQQRWGSFAARCQGIHDVTCPSIR